MTIDINEITQGLPGLSKISGQHLYESCVVCLSRHTHNNLGTAFNVYGDNEINYNLIWDNIFDEQLDRTWADQFYATEHGAVCLAILIALKLTDFTIIEKSARKNGLDTSPMWWRRSGMRCKPTTWCSVVAMPRS